MNIWDQKKELAPLQLSSNTLVILSNGLNEVLHALKVQNLEERSGMSQSELELLLNKISSKLDSNTAESSIVFTRKQLVALHFVLVETCAEIDDREFQTRTGEPKQSFLDLAQFLIKAGNVNNASD